MKVRIGVIGLGYWGPNLLRALVALEECEVIYLCDKDELRLQQSKKLYPHVKLTHDANLVFSSKEVEAVIIATPSDTHFNLTKIALQKGKHVLVEKPMTLRALDARQLVDLAKKQNKILMVGHTYEYHPAILEIKQYLKEGELGDIFYLYCTRTNLGKIREETNALWNLAPHDISVLLFLLDMNPIGVAAYGQSYLQKNYEDVVYINLKFPKKIIAHVHVSWLDPRKERKMTLIGSKKMIIFDDLDNEASVRIYDKGFDKLKIVQSEQIYREFSLKLRPGDIHLPYIPTKEPLKEECFHFLESIRTHKKPRSDGLNGLAVVRILESADKSLKHKNVWIPIPK